MSGQRWTIWLLTGVLGAWLLPGCVTTGSRPIEPERVQPLDTSRRTVVDPDTVHAWIINGDRERRHRSNASRACRRLLEIGVPADQILVVSEGPRPQRRLPPQNFAAPERENLRRQAAVIRERVDDESTLIIYLTGHGAKSQRRTRSADTRLVLLGGNNLSAWDLLEEVGETLPAKQIVLIADMCYGGGFVETFEQVDTRYTGIAATDKRHTTCCQPFAPRFWNHVSDFDRATLRASFDHAAGGCEQFQDRGRCRHTKTCSSYRRRAVFVHQGGNVDPSEVLTHLSP